MRFPRIVKALDQRVFLESCLNDSALYARTAPVNQPHFTKSGPVRLIHVLFDHRFDVSGREDMQIDRVFNRDFQRLRLRLLLLAEPRRQPPNSLSLVSQAHFLLNPGTSLIVLSAKSSHMSPSRSC